MKYLDLYRVSQKKSPFWNFSRTNSNDFRTSQTANLTQDKLQVQTGPQILYGFVLENFQTGIFWDCLWIGLYHNINTLYLIIYEEGSKCRKLKKNAIEFFFLSSLKCLLFNSTSKKASLKKKKLNFAISQQLSWMSKNTESFVRFQLSQKFLYL